MEGSFDAPGSGTRCDGGAGVNVALCGAGSGFIACVGEADAVLPTVQDLRAVRGETGGEAMGFVPSWSLGAHRSRTEDFRPPLDGLGSSEVPDAVSELRLEETLTMFCTKPLPWRRLRLGVRSFGEAVRWKAGEGDFDAAICGP